MTRALLALPLLLLSAAAEEAPFTPAEEVFDTPARCRAFLVAITDEWRARGFDVAEGPYSVGAGDIRIHGVRPEGAGHLIIERRCLAEKLSGRSWVHAMQDAQPDFTVDSVARDAPWLKKDRAQQ